MARMYRVKPIEARFWSKVDFDGPGGCWLWTRGLDQDGYGQFRASTAMHSRAHRVAFALWYGYWPPEQTDHLCRTPRCVNPLHLEAVTPLVNTLRGDSPSALNAKKTHCKRGHPLAADNLRIKRGRTGRPLRICRTCRNADARARYVPRG